MRMQPSYIKADPDDYRAGSSNRFVIATKVGTPRNVANGAAVFRNNPLLLPLACSGVLLPNLRVVLGSDYHTHHVIPRFAPRQTVRLLVQEEARFLLPAPQLEHVLRSIYVHGSILKANGLHVTPLWIRYNVQTHKTGAECDIIRRRTR